ncbi:MAG: hypothetical protein M1816_001156 [Peltula sp. TS41687]|nr:MAG: hypothetical protein M1816_001156 [Peltula sp. TS41687]
MASIISIGDVLMLSQVAWKLGCAFTAARAGAPEAFLAVEDELVRLTTALDQLAETLDDDAETLANTNETTQAGISRVLIRCRQTLQDLNSFTARYLDPTRSNPGAPNGEQAVERSWKKVLIKNWSTVWWTPEGGSIDDLLESLQTHANSIALIIHALQSQSLSQIEGTVTMLALPVEDAHDGGLGRMNTTIDDMRQQMTSRASQRGPEASNPSSAHSRGHRRGTGLTSSTTESGPLGRASAHSNSSYSHHSSRTPHHNVNYILSPGMTPDLVGSEGAPAMNEPSISTMSPLGSPYRLPERYSSMRLSPVKSSQGSLDWDVSRGQPHSHLLSPEDQISQAIETREEQARRQQNWPLLTRPDPSHFRSPPQRPTYTPIATSQDPNSFRRPTRDQSDFLLTPAPLSVPPRSPLTSSDMSGLLRQPQPTPDLYSYLVPAAQSPADNALHLFPHLPSVQQPQRNDPGPNRGCNTPTPPTEPGSLDLREPPFVVGQEDKFEKALRQHSMILCEVKGKLVEYTQWDVNEMDYILVQVATDCRIYLTQQQEHQSDAGIRYSTSIWVLSEDRKVRFQQKLLPGQTIIPYTIWGTINKVAIRVKSFLEFHDTVYGALPIKTGDSGWVNYVFGNEAASKMFQTAMMGKTLLLSVSTNKTIRAHEGLSGTFASQEQMCALENLRIWQDDESNGVLAMIHFTPQFRKGYLAFYLNSQRDPIRIREENDRVIKVKGLKIFLDPKSGTGTAEEGSVITMGTGGALRYDNNNNTNNTNSNNETKITTPPRTATSMGPPITTTTTATIGRRKSGKRHRHHHRSRPESKRMITAAKIEFTTEYDKNAFLMMFREVQGRFFPG